MHTSITCLLALLLSAAGHIFAQNIKAALNGRALDSQNNAVANAAIVGANPEQGQSRSLVSDAQGGLHLAGLDSLGLLSLNTEERK
ncbi:MAG: carboxypeptidase regulatory-like domain-containing protein [Blastocatellia bacterium]|nr:carboxypeptidase regulatory-like domain-containing protein [Blastocatellia bacterium]